VRSVGSLLSVEISTVPLLRLRQVHAVAAASL
jgi:hypothetical protein